MLQPRNSLMPSPGHWGSREPEHAAHSRLPSPFNGTNGLPKSSILKSWECQTVECWSSGKKPEIYTVYTVCKQPVDQQQYWLAVTVAAAPPALHARRCPPARP